MKVYIDESGNSGDNLSDGNQKIFTIAAIGIRDEYENIIESRIEEIITKIPSTSDNELKTNKVIGTKHEPLLIEIVDYLLENNFLPFIIVIEKKFMIAGKIIENLIDPVYNDVAGNEWLNPGDHKLIFANYLYDNLSNETLNLSSIAFQQGRLDDIKIAYDSIVHELENLPNSEDYLRLIIGAKSHLEDLSKDIIGADYIFIEKNQGRKGVLNSPNFTAYRILINSIERRMRDEGQKCKVYFDTSRQFDSSFQELYNLLKNAPNKDFQFGEVNLIYGLEWIEEFQVLKSEESIGIQIGDLFSTSITHLIKKLLSNPEKILTSYEKFILGYLIIMYYDGMTQFVMSFKLMERIFNKFEQEFKNEN